MYPCTMGESSGSSNQMTLVIETQSNLASYLPPVRFDTSRSCAKQGSHVRGIEEIMEESKSHWSHVGEFDSTNELVEVSNMELFKTLQGHPTWGTFFVTFGEGEGYSGELVMGKLPFEGHPWRDYDLVL